MYPNQPPQQKPARSLGGIQQTFAYNLRNLSVINQQFTIVEDLPKNKPLRQKAKVAKNGSTYFVDTIKISANNFEADLELMGFETDSLAVLCPRDTQNFKGSTFAFDGQRWQFVCGDMPSIGTDPRQPNLYAPNEQRPPAPPAVDQQTIFIQRLAGSITALNAIGTDVTGSDMIKIAEKITPGDALGLIAAAKMAGYIIESNGIFKVA